MFFVGLRQRHVAARVVFGDARQSRFEAAEDSAAVQPRTGAAGARDRLFVDSANDLEFLKIAFGFGKENLAWRQRERIAPEGGFCYLDMLFSGP